MPEVEEEKIERLQEEGLESVYLALGTRHYRGDYEETGELLEIQFEGAQHPDHEVEIHYEGEIPLEICEFTSESIDGRLAGFYSNPISIALNRLLNETGDYPEGDFQDNLTIYCFTPYNLDQFDLSPEDSIENGSSDENGIVDKVRDLFGEDDKENESKGETLWTDVLEEEFPELYDELGTLVGGTRERENSFRDEEEAARKVGDDDVYFILGFEEVENPEEELTEYLEELDEDRDLRKEL